MCWSSYEIDTTTNIQGLLDVVPPRFLALFSPQELSEVVAGPRSIDWAELRKMVQYERGLGPHSPVVQGGWVAG